MEIFVPVWRPLKAGLWKAAQSLVGVIVIGSMHLWKEDGEPLSLSPPKKA